MKHAQVIDADRIDAQWFTRMLRDTGVLAASASVRDLDAEPIGNGMLGESVRFFLRYDGQPGNAPLTLVGKFPSRSEVSRETSIRFNLYMSEINFYQSIAKTLKVRTPRAYFSEIDPATHDFTLLLEDLSPGRGGNQLEGCSVADCRVAMQEAAAMHGPRWGDPSLEEVSIFQDRTRLDEEQVIPALAPVSKSFVEMLEGVLEPQYLDVAKRFAPIYARILRDHNTAPRTVQHSDFRLDNVLFDAAGIPGSMATLDWQTVTLGPGLVDVAFFIGGSLSIEERRSHEKELVRLYHKSLQAHGVQNYSWDRCWMDYRRFAFQGLFTAIFSMVKVGRTDRGDEMFLKMARQHGQQIIDLDSFSAWL